MLNRIGTTDNIPDFIGGVKEGKEKLMGFGHRVYKNYDPRAKIIKKACDDVFEVTGVNPLLKIAQELEKITLEDEYFVKRKLYPNVDFYSGLIYEALQFPANVHRLVRDRPYAGLAGAMGGAGAGQGAEDRATQTDLHRHPNQGLHPAQRALVFVLCSRTRRRSDAHRARDDARRQLRTCSQRMSRHQLPVHELWAKR